MVEFAAGDKRIYEASDGHKTVLAIAFLILLPFLISMPIMFFKRSIHGLWSDALSGAVFAVLFGAWMAFLFTQVMSSMRTRVAFGETSLNLRIPNWRGPNPGVKFVKRRIPYNQITAVETRGEIYRNAKIPVLTCATSIVLHDGERVVLGYQNEHEEDPDIDYQVIAAQISKVAGVPLVDRGKVVAGSHLKAFRAGEGPSWDKEPITENAYLRLKARNRRLMSGITLGILALATAGLLYDFYRTGFLPKLIEMVTGPGTAG